MTESLEDEVKRLFGDHITDLDSNVVIMELLNGFVIKGWVYILETTNMDGYKFTYMKGKTNATLASYWVGHTLGSQIWWRVLCKMQETELKLKDEEDNSIEPSDILDRLAENPDLEFNI
jgi:hypothetical protein